MGSCSTDFNDKHRALNNHPTYFPNQNVNPKNSYITTLNDNKVTNSNSNKINNPNVYKISRKKKNSHKKINKIIFFNYNFKYLKHTNTNNSSNSKTKYTTEASDQYLSSRNSYLNSYHFSLDSRLKTIEEDRNTISSFNKQYSFHDNSEIQKNNLRSYSNFDKYFNEKMQKIRKKITFRDKELSVIVEETSNKNNNKKKKIENKNANQINNEIFISNTVYFQCLKTISDGHKDKIVCLTEISMGKIATGSYDNTIKIWNINSFSNTCENSINEEGNVLCLLEFENNLLLSGNSKNNINLFNLNNNLNNKIFSFKGHELWVNNLVKLNNNYFASCSNDHQIRIWDFYKRNCFNVLSGHVDGVLSLFLLSDGKLCSGGGDLSIKIWIWQNGQCVSTLLGHKKWIKCLYQLSNNYIVSGSDDKTIKVWMNNKCVRNLIGHERSVRTICQINNYFFASGSFDKTIKIWDIFNFNCVQTIFAHNDLILNIIRKKTGEIVSCSNDHEIKIWRQIIN